MRFLFILLLISTSSLAQSSTDLQNQIKFKNYKYLDSIDIYSKDYSTQLIEGSGIIKNAKNKNIGSIGFSIEIMRDKNDRVIRILKSESNHYEKFAGKPKKNIINEIAIYFNDFQQPDLAKYQSEIYISNALVMGKNKLFNLNSINDDPDFKLIETVLNETKKYIK